MSHPFTPDTVDELLWLTDGGVPAEEALSRVGWSLPAAYRWALRHHHQPLLNVLRPAATVDARYAARRAS